MGDMTTVAEKTRFEELDKIVKQGQKTFFSVGEALAEIRDKRLYRAVGLNSFESYCKEYRGITRRHADNLIQATKVRTADLRTLPSDVSFKAAKAVAAVPEEDRQEVVEEAVQSAKVEGRKVTASDVKKAAGKTQANKGPVNAILLDPKGQAIPERIQVAFGASRKRLKALSVGLTKWQTELFNLANEEDAYKHYLKFGEIKNSITDIKNILAYAVPATVCPYCEGVGCETCRESGYLTSHQAGVVPEEHWNTLVTEK